MRVSVLCIIVATSLLLGKDAHAQTPMDDPYRESTYGPPRSNFHQAFDYPHIPSARRFQEIRVLSFDERGRPILSIASGWYFRTRGESYRPTETMGVRDEGVGVTYEFSERFTVTGGVDRSKLRLNGLPSLRTEPVYGFRVRYTF